MSTDTSSGPSTTTVSLTHARLPRWAPALVGVMALAAAGLPAMVRGWGMVAWVVLSVVLFLVALPAWSLVVENRRAATDRLMTGLIWTAFLRNEASGVVATLNPPLKTLRPLGVSKGTAKAI